jgi:hypothetical protein
VIQTVTLNLDGHVALELEDVYQLVKMVLYSKMRNVTTKLAPQTLAVEMIAAEQRSDGLAQAHLLFLLADSQIAHLNVKTQ